MNTSTYKNHYKVWETKSTIMLDEKHELSITTQKNSNGILTTRASVGILEDGFISHVLFQDFSKQLQAEKIGRITEKVNIEFHNRIDKEAVIKEAKTFYNIA